jgi:putative membrane protein
VTIGPSVRSPTLARRLRDVAVATVLLLQLGAIVPGRAESPALDVAAPSGHRTAGLNQTDRAFVTVTAAAGIGAVEAARIVAERARDPEVRAFAQQLVREQTRANDELRHLATEKDVRLPTAPTEDQRASIVKLRERSGSALDLAFVEQFGVVDHRRHAALFESELATGADEDLKEYAARQLPRMRERLGTAQDLRARVLASGPSLVR